VSEVVVIAREDTPGEKRLVAYYTLGGTEGEAASAEQLRSHVLAALPDYMVPAAYVILPCLPLTPNGKLDRKALPEPEQDAFARQVYEAPEGETEVKLAGIWAEVLKVERIGRHDNFFELGGHSLLALRVNARLRQAFNVEVGIDAVFTHPQLADMACLLERAAPSALPAMVRVERSQPLPLSFAQQRLWFLAQMKGGSAAYHVPMNLKLKGDLDRAALRHALDRIVERHEALRTSFIFVDGEPRQRIAAAGESGFLLLEQDVRGHLEAEGELERLMEEEAGAAFDLEKGPVIRGRLIRLSDDEHALLITMHHIASDGWSMGVLGEELSVLYRAFVRGEGDPLPEPAIQYADYAVWQRQWMEGEILQRQGAYWKTVLSGAPALLELPGDHPRPVQQQYAGAFAKWCWTGDSLLG
jgi:hypothetical protein